MYHKKGDHVPDDDDKMYKTSTSESGENLGRYGKLKERTMHHTIGGRETRRIEMSSEDITQAWIVSDNYVNTAGMA